MLSISCASLEQRWKHLISRPSTGNEMGAEFNGAVSEVARNSRAGLHYGIMRQDRRPMHRPICGRDKWEINGHWLRSDCYCQAPRPAARWGGFMRFSPINEPLGAQTSDGDRLQNELWHPVTRQTEPVTFRPIQLFICISLAIWVDVTTVELLF